jgi:hypothetical protein
MIIGMPIRRLALALFWAGLSSLSPVGLLAQFDQYKSPGSPAENAQSRKEALDVAIEEAKWRLGRLRVDPWLSLRNIEYVDNAFGVTEGVKVSDITATVGAGLRAYLPTGGKMVWAAHILPEYVYWQDLSERRSVNGRYGVGAFGFFNHLTFEATANRDQALGFATSEVLQQVRLRSDRAGLSFDLKISGPLSIFASGAQIELRNLVQGDDPRLAPLDQLDRDETLLRAGLRYRFPGGLSVGFGSERSEVKFVTAGGTADDRSNEGDSPFVEILQQGGNSLLRVEVVQRSLEPSPDSRFLPYDATTTSFEARFNLKGRVVPWIYGSRSLIYSLDDSYSDFQDDRIGLSLDRSLGWRTQLRIYGEKGTNDYRAVASGTPDRQDDTLSFGAVLSFKMRRSASLSFQAARTKIDSNLPGFDRSITTFGGGLSFGSRGSWY